jgi:hypothetical protein
VKDVKGVKDTLRFERGGYKDMGGLCISTVCGVLQDYKNSFGKDVSEHGDLMSVVLSRQW